MADTESNDEKLEMVRRNMVVADNLSEVAKRQPTEAEIRASEALSVQAEKFLLQAGDTKPDLALKARNMYLQSVVALVGKDWVIPGPTGSGFRNEFYIHLTTEARKALMTCCNGIGRSLVSMGFGDVGLTIDKVLAWLDELDLIAMNWFSRFPQCLLHDWELHDNAIPEVTVYRVCALSWGADILKLIGNTGRAQYLLLLVDRYIGTAREDLGGDLSTWFHQAEENRKLFPKLLHPDPRWQPEARGSDPALRCEGAWTKIPVKVDEAMGRRSVHSAFVWKSHLYVVGGKRDSSDRESRDVWRLNLAKPEAWQFMCLCPVSKDDSWKLRCQDMRVHEDKAYLFFGGPTVLYYDLILNRWGSIETRFTPTEGDKQIGVQDWPWEGNRSFNAAVQFIRGKLLCFGGGHCNSFAGCNILMELDMETKVWRRLNGFPNYRERNHPHWPPARLLPGSWVSKDQRKFYILFGETNPDRGPKPKMAGDFFAPKERWVFDDLWSWDVVDERWRRERVSGNPPAPRTGMGCVYNEKLDRVIVFGGTNMMIGHESQETGKETDFVLFGDAFVWQPLAGNATVDNDSLSPWQQVISWGFPTHRAYHQLICDPDTGKIYLHGGAARTEIIPSKQSSSIVRPFGDVWQLHLDIPGGDFECTDREDQMRTAAVGSWQRCLNCLQVGQWMKCGGSCGGHAFFCGKECLKKGWKDHKRLHNCRKI